MSITTLSSRVVYANQWLGVREDRIEYADGSRGLHRVIDKPDFALIIPMQDDGFHLVEQYRYPVRRRSWEFPSGSFPPGVTGSDQEMAAAELAEETRLRAGRLEKLGYLHCANGMSGEGVHVFLATELTAGEPTGSSPGLGCSFARWIESARQGLTTDTAQRVADAALSLSPLAWRDR